MGQANLTVQAYGNIPRSIEFAVDATARFIQYCTENEIIFAEAKQEGVDQWTVSHSLQPQICMVADAIADIGSHHGNCQGSIITRS